MDSAFEHRLRILDGEVVSAMITWKRLAKVRNAVLPAVTSMDMCVHPRLQRQGFITRGRDEERAYDADLSFGYPSGHAAVAAMRRRRPPRRGKPIANMVDVLEHRLTGTLGRGDAHEEIVIRSIPAFDERFDSFWVEAQQPFDFAIDRRAAYMDWRYGDPRAGRFTVRQATRDREVVGYCVLAFGEEDRGFIADLLALPGRVDVVTALVRDALNHFVEQGVATVEYWMPSHHPYRELVAGLGFDQKRRTLEMRRGARRIDPAELAFLDDPRARVHISMGDTDLV
jgi:hypothetical protein